MGIPQIFIGVSLRNTLRYYRYPITTARRIIISLCNQLSVVAIYSLHESSRFLTHFSEGWFYNQQGDGTG